MRILRIVQSRSLPCGCFVGLYETYDGSTVAIVEEPGRECGSAGHEAGRTLPLAGLMPLPGSTAAPDQARTEP
jgi:hypothetical protein